MTEQKIIVPSDNYSEIDEYINENSIKSILLVCDVSIEFLEINGYFKKLEELGKTKVIRFCNFQSNPLYESVVEGVEAFNFNRCDAIFAVGGGSAMDVAKCIKLYSNMDHSLNYLDQMIVPNNVKLVALPTTAGTGSEATRYAVIYYKDAKQSVTHESIIPTTVVFDSSVLVTLPIYQKRATMMDALCHAIESFWSVNSNDESRAYSREAIELIIENMESYIAGNVDKNEIMLKAANIAGKAINITQTTAGHAMCYKLTSLYGIAHGHAVALCVPALWEFMLNNIEKCIDRRGNAYIEQIFVDIALAMGCSDPYIAVKKLHDIVSLLKLDVPHMTEVEDFEVLRGSVNPVRLKNNPIELSVENIDEIYHNIFEEKRK